MKYTFNSIYLYFLILILSCNNKKNSNTDYINNQSDNIYPIEAKKNSLFQWPEEVVIDEIIYLHTSEDVLVSSLTKLIISPDQDKYIIQDRKQKKVFIFNEDGEILSVFHKPGDGPEDHLEMRNVHIDFKAQTLEILSYQKIQKYDLNNLSHLGTTSLRNIKGDNNYTKFISFGDIYYLWTNIPRNQRLDLIEVTKYNLFHLIRKEGDQYDYFVPYENGLFADQKFYPSNIEGEFNISPILGRNNILGIKKDGLIEKYNFPFASNNAPSELIKNFVGNEIEFLNSDYFKFLTTILETDNLIYFEFYGNAKGYQVLYDIKLKKMISVGKERIYNLRTIASGPQHFYSYISPAPIYDDIKNGLSYENHPLLKHVDLDKVDQQDNPIIIKFHIPQKDQENIK